MKTPGFADNFPSQEVEPTTLRELRTTMNRWFNVLPPKRSKAFPQGPTVKATYAKGNVQQDWDFPTPNSVVSGQIYDPTQRSEFVVMTPLEGTPLSAATINGKEVTPCGSVRKISSDPTDHTGESSVSRIIIPTLEGPVFEVDEGVYMSDEYCRGEVSVRELGNQEVLAFVSELAAAYDAQAK